MNINSPEYRAIVVKLLGKDVEFENVIKTPKSKTNKKCNACSDKHWWCCGCGGQMKISSLKSELGITSQQAEEIYEEQFGPCDTFVPCYLCNKNGKLGTKLGPRKFWST